jgi:hypothetical protein
MKLINEEGVRLQDVSQLFQFSESCWRRLYSTLLLFAWEGKFAGWSRPNLHWKHAGYLYICMRDYVRIVFGLGVLWLWHKYLNWLTALPPLSIPHLCVRIISLFRIDSVCQVTAAAVECGYWFTQIFVEMNTRIILFEKMDMTWIKSGVSLFSSPFISHFRMQSKVVIFSVVYRKKQYWQYKYQITRVGNFVQFTTQHVSTYTRYHKGHTI